MLCRTFGHSELVRECVWWQKPKLVSAVGVAGLNFAPNGSRVWLSAEPRGLLSRRVKKPVHISCTRQ